MSMALEKPSVTLRIKRTNIFLLPIKIAYMLIGVFFLLVAIVLCVCIVTIPIGLPLGWGAVGLILAMFNRQKVKCPSCGYDKNVVKNRVLNFTCRKCKEITLIDWTK